MNVVVVRDQHRPHLGGNLNVRQLLNPLFYDGAWLRPLSKHPDRKRQRKARLKALALHQARSLKAMEVPLRLVDCATVASRNIRALRGTKEDRSHRRTDGEGSVKLRLTEAFANAIKES
jgi:hypothetical protein